MAFSSSVCSFHWHQNSVVLRRGQTTLQIVPDDASTLRTMKDEDTFFAYFRGTALKNREARRVFESWERKESDLIKKIYQEMTSAQ